MGIDKDGKLLKLLETFSALTGEQGRVETTVPGDEDHPIVVNEPMSDEPITTTAVSMRQPTDLERYEQLPVSEPDYVPSTSDELARACRLVLRDVPNERVAVMWKNIMKLMDKTADDASIMRTGFESTQERSKMKNETKVRQVIRHLIKEIGYGRKKWDTTTEMGPSSADLDKIEMGLDDDVSDMPEIPVGSKGTGAIKKAVMGMSKGDYDLLQSIAGGLGEDPADVVADEEEAEQIRRRKYVTAGEEGMSLKDIASKMGYLVPSSVKNLLYIIEDKIKYFASLDEVWFRDMMREFARAYVEELLDAGGRKLTKADVAFLTDTLVDVDELDQITEMDTFRLWAQEGLNKVYKSQSGKKMFENKQKMLEASISDRDRDILRKLSQDDDDDRESVKGYALELLDQRDLLSKKDIEFLQSIIKNPSETQIEAIMSSPGYQKWIKT